VKISRASFLIVMAANRTIGTTSSYMGRTYDYGGDIMWSIKNGETSVPTKHADVDEKTTATDKRIWEKDIDEYVRRKVNLTVNRKKIYSLILGQCTDYLKAKLEWLDQFKVIERNFDVIKLIKALKSLSYHIESHIYHPKALHKAKKGCYLFNQNKDITNAKFLEAFQTLVLMVMACGGVIGYDLVGVATALQEKGITQALSSDNDLKEAAAAAMERYLTVSMLSSYDKSRYNKLSEDLENHYTKGSNLYPKTTT
jgi:hypothetical protein